MKKESLKLENIKKDLQSVAYEKRGNAEEWRFSYIVPFTALAVLVGILFESIPLGLLAFSLAAYQIFLFVRETKKHRDIKKALNGAIERGDISISMEILSHVSEETIYEPHIHTRGGRIDRDVTKDVSVLYFMSGGSWRIPKGRLYEWSSDYYLSPEGLKNISVQGNEYFYVCLQGYYDVAYAYPGKFFELDESLKAKSKENK